MGLIRTVSVLIARPRDSSSSQTGGFFLHNRKGIIHPPVVADEASSTIPASLNSRASSVGILHEPSHALPEEDGGKGNRPTSPQTCMSLSKIAEFNRLWIHSGLNTDTLACCSGMVLSSFGSAKRVLIVLARWR
ncbi:hypothetical protein TcCL_ESM10362 [Trypanosoma cruzi]|nr:hypothetical protein TcCL_ESM10362 [Trypanosoma cruzi]